MSQDIFIKTTAGLALIIGVITNGLNLMGINSFWQQIKRQLPINSDPKRFPFAFKLPVIKSTGSWQAHIDAPMIL